jgi:hypothetical protein
MSTQTGETEAAVAVAGAPEAPRYADPDVALQVAGRLTNAKIKGFTRPMLCELTGMNGSAVWRAQNGRIHPDEVAAVTGVLDRIESGEVAPPERATHARVRRATRADLQARAARADALLAETDNVKTVREVRALVGRARAALAGADESRTDAETDTTE